MEFFIWGPLISVLKFHDRLTEQPKMPQPRAIMATKRVVNQGQIIFYHASKSTQTLNPVTQSHKSNTIFPSSFPSSPFPHLAVSRLFPFSFHHPFHPCFIFPWWSELPLFLTFCLSCPYPWGTDVLNNSKRGLIYKSTHSAEMSQSCSSVWRLIKA